MREVGQALDLDKDLPKMDELLMEKYGLEKPYEIGPTPTFVDTQFAKSK